MAVRELALDEVRPTLGEAIAGRDARRLFALLQQLRPGDVFQALYELDRVELARVVTLLGDERLADLIENLDAADAARLLLKLSRAEAADVLEEMDPDDAAELVEELDPSDAEAILIEMNEPEADDIRELMAHPPESAARLMTMDYVTVSPELTAEQALVAIRRLAQEAETIYYVYVTDNTGHLMGVLNLRDLVVAAPNTPISQITNRALVTVPAEADRELAARVLAARGLLAIPVVSADGRLLGIITADDVSDVLEEEATEDIARLGGSEPLDEPYTGASVMTLVRKRVGWLLILFVGAAITGNVLQYFEATLDQVVALTFFIPLLIGTGGNVGSQIVTTLVRAMAVGEVGIRDLGRVLRKELLVAIVVGVIMAVATFIRAWTLGVGPGIGIVVASTAIIIVVWAAAVGAVLPILLRKAGVDPAVVSTPFISTLVDGTGLFIYFTIARSVLHVL